MDDVHWVRRLQQGHRDAFNVLYQKYSAQALKTAYLITGSREMAEDIVQETFIRSYYELHKLKDPQAFKAWFYKILTHLCWRWKPKEKAYVSIDEMADQGLEIFQSTLGLEDPVEANELRGMVREAIRTLEPPLQAVIILYYFNDLSIKEIAKVMKCFEGTVKSRLYYARKRLMKCMENHPLVHVYFDESIDEREYDFHEKASVL